MSILRLALLFVLCLPALAGPTMASPICLMDGRGERPTDVTDCPKTTNPCGSNQAITTPWLGAALDAGYASTPIDIFGRCRYLDSVANEEFFVPFASEKEWTSFLAALPPTVSATPCARPFSGVDAAKKLYIGPTTAQPSLGDTGDAPYAPVSLPYARTGAVWPPAGSSCASTSQIFRHSCYEEVPTYKCWNWVPKTCAGYTCAASANGECTSPVATSIDCSYCADPGSTCEKKQHDWTETFTFVATALNSDTEEPSWQGQSARVAGSTRPTECATRCTNTGHDCTNCAGSCVANGTTSCSAGILKDSCGRAIGKCCAPDGLSYCVANRKLDSCGKDIGVCNQTCTYKAYHESGGWAGTTYKATLNNGQTATYSIDYHPKPPCARGCGTLCAYWTSVTATCVNGNLVTLSSKSMSRCSKGQSYGSLQRPASKDFICDYNPDKTRAFPILSKDDKG